MVLYIYIYTSEKEYELTRQIYILHWRQTYPVWVIVHKDKGACM